MAVYILEFSEALGNPDNPHGQARYYVGYADDVLARLETHRKGRGASITRAAVEQGYDLKLVAVFEGDRSVERRVKDLKNTPRLVARFLTGRAPEWLRPILF